MLQTILPYFKPYLSKGICIAFSGGADSTLLLKAACMARETQVSDPAPADPKRSAAQPPLTSATQPTGNPSAASNKIPRILAVVAETRLHPHEDTLQAQELARSLGADCIILSVDEFSDPRIMDNPVNRCYLCKRLLFSSIKKTAAENGRLHVFDGTNIDDTREYRPGLAALEELGIHSPLKELGIRKQQVRELSRELQLKTFDKPSAPCMATRLPYGSRLDYELLDRIHRGETFLRGLGFYNVRLRYHAPLLRIEVDSDALARILEQRDVILRTLKALNFTYITLDLEGFRSGSMDVGLSARSYHTDPAI